MACYPEILLPRKSYPILENEDVRENALVRETTTDVYQFLSKAEYEPDDILHSIDIKFSQEKIYPLFFAAAKLDRQEIDFNGEMYILSFSHKPTRANYWHFELWVKDSTGNRIPRDKSNAHTKYLAKSILEYIIAEAVILKVSVNLFRRSGFKITK